MRTRRGTRRRDGVEHMAKLSRGRASLMGEINVVPYIDVMLVLLIIFMITAPLLTQGIKVDLPKAAAEPLDVRAERAAAGAVDRSRRAPVSEFGRRSQAVARRSTTARARHRRAASRAATRGAGQGRSGGGLWARGRRPW